MCTLPSVLDEVSYRGSPTQHGWVGGGLVVKALLIMMKAWVWFPTWYAKQSPCLGPPCRDIAGILLKAVFNSLTNQTIKLMTWTVCLKKLNKMHFKIWKELIAYPLFIYPTNKSCLLLSFLSPFIHLSSTLPVPPPFFTPSILHPSFITMHPSFLSSSTHLGLLHYNPSIFHLSILDPSTSLSIFHSFLPLPSIISSSIIYLSVHLVILLSILPLFILYSSIHPSLTWLPQEYLASPSICSNIHAWATLLHLFYLILKLNWYIYMQHPGHCCLLCNK